MLPPPGPREPLFGFEPDVLVGAVVAVPEGVLVPVVEDPDVPLVPIDEPVVPLPPFIDEPVEPPVPVIEEPDEPLVPVVEEPDVPPPVPIIAPPAPLSVVVGPALFDMPVELLLGEPLVGDDTSLLSFPHAIETVAHSSATPIVIFMVFVLSR